MKYFFAVFCIALLLIISSCTSNNEKNVPAEDIKVSKDNFDSSQAADLSKVTNQIDLDEMNFNEVEFGDTRQEVINKLGQPESISELYGDYTYKNYTLAFNELDSMCEVRILDKDYTFYKGIKLGDNIVSTLELLPVPTTPSGMGVLYGNFNGNYENDFRLLEDYLTENIRDPEAPNELNRYYRAVEFSFQKCVLKIEYMASGMEKDAYKDFDAGQICGVWIETDDAPSFED